MKIDFFVVENWPVLLVLIFCEHCVRSVICTICGNVY